MMVDAYIDLLSSLAQMSRSVSPRLAVAGDSLQVPRTKTNDLPQVSVLLVDDRPENLLALEAVLEPLGQRLVQARSGGAALQAVLAEQAHRDALTGLANRKLLLEHLHHAVAQLRRQGKPRSAVMMIDLDRFKAVNDSRGHLVGDKLLVEVARRLERCLRDVDTAARFGGDEFAILLDAVDEVRDATRIADRIHAALAKPIALDGVEVTISASIGIALVDQDYERGEELLRDADIALYRAKEAGRARTDVFTPAD